MAEAAMLGGGAPGDTFLTDMLLTGNPKSKAGVTAKKQGKATFSTATKPNLRSGSSNGRQQTEVKDRGDDYLEESQADSDLEDEYRDVVYDVDQSRALV